VTLMVGARSYPLAADAARWLADVIRVDRHEAPY